MCDIIDLEIQNDSVSELQLCYWIFHLFLKKTKINKIKELVGNM